MEMRRWNSGEALFEESMIIRNRTCVRVILAHEHDDRPTRTDVCILMLASSAKGNQSLISSVHISSLNFGPEAAA
jgi:hypothetical protein